MSEALQRGVRDIDRDALLTMGVLPAVATLVAMTVNFLIVVGLLFVAEGILVSNFVTIALTLGWMYLVPQFLVGVGMGTRYGLSPVPPVVIAITPLFALVLSFGVFGGPLLTPAQSPLLTLGAAVAWGLAAAGGVLLGANVVAPRLAEWRAGR